MWNAILVTLTHHCGKSYFLRKGELVEKYLHRLTKPFDTPEVRLTLDAWMGDFE
jgi:hypothetical protein